jgi:hypothetical protein
MRKRNLALVLSAIIIVGLAMLWLWLGVPASSRVRQTSIVTQSNMAPPTSPQANTNLETTTGQQMPGGQPEPSDPRWKEREMKRRIDPQYEWKMPINFYGRVLDENEQPVSDATIAAQWSDLSPNGATNETTFSDDQGFFSITGKTGRGITIRVSKHGYHTPKRQRISFDYADFWEANYHVPHPNNPVIFHLRKTKQGEALRSGEFRPAIPSDGTPVRFNLLNGGRVSPDGQLEIAAVTNTEQYPPRIFNWRASILVPGGGLIEYNDDFPFEAPEGGYQPSVEFDMPTNALNWKPLVEKSYFIKFGSPPKYGRIQIRLNGASQKASVSYWVNPSGSRNLEANTTEQVSSR